MQVPSAAAGPPLERSPSSWYERRPWIGDLSGDLIVARVRNPVIEKKLQTRRARESGAIANGRILRTLTVIAKKPRLRLRTGPEAHWLTVDWCTNLCASYEIAISSKLRTSYLRGVSLLSAVVRFPSP